MSSKIKVGFAPSILCKIGSGSNSGTTQNKYASFFSHMDKISDVGTRLDEVVVSKNKWGTDGH